MSTIFGEVQVGVSLYYIAYISQELKDYKRAVTFYNLIEKLSEEDKKDVIQAARMQVGDIYLIQVERQRDPFKGVESYVIPQYEKALQYDEESKLAGEIKSKIENLQRRYELILFRMRNGRPTARPPYYIRANVLYGTNDNVTSITEDDKTADGVEEEDYASTYTQVGFFSRYSFYPSSSFSYAPEFSTQMTKYNSDSTSILPFNSYFVKGALKMNYEHLYRKLPATFFMDLDYTYNADDADADEEFAASDNTYGITLSEEVQFWDNNPSTFRFRFENVAAEEETNLRSVMSLSYEQIVLLSKTTLFFYNNYAVTTYTEAETSNTTALTTRLDAIFPTFYKLFNPTLYVSLLSTDYPDFTEDRTTQLTTLGINLNRPLGNKFYLTMDMSQGSQTGDLDSDIYTQQVITFNIDYIY